MAVADMIPTISDKELETLRANAIRLRDTGVAKQKAAAEELLPLIEAEQAARIAARPPPAARARKTLVKKKKSEAVDPD
jgi:hypothetical protein